MLDPSVGAVLKSKYTIRAFYLSFGALFVATTLAALFLGTAMAEGGFGDVVVAFFLQLSSTFATIMAVYGVWIFVTPRELRDAVIIPLRPKEIGEYLQIVREGAGQYVFVGRSGNAFRGQVLPKLDSESRRLREVRVARVVVPDPSVAENASTYRTVLAGLNEPADENTLLIAVAAMALDLANRSANNPDLRLDMALSKTMPILRMDLSERGGVLTRDAPLLPGIYCSSGGYLEMFRAIAENDFRQSSRVGWEPGVSFESISTAEDFNTKFHGLPRISEEMISKIVALAKEPRHRYGN